MGKEKSPLDRLAEEMEEMNLQHARRDAEDARWYEAQAVKRESEAKNE